MYNLRRRENLKNLLYSPISLALLLILAFLLLKGAWGIVEKERQSRLTISELEESNRKLSSREQELRQHIDNLATEEGVTQEIRAKFNAIREGEHLAVIVNEKEVARPASTTIEKIKAHWSSFLKWWHFW